MSPVAHAKAEEELGNLEDQFEKGEFAPLLGWLRKNIHSNGQKLRPHDLIKLTTGNDPDPSYFIDYCEKKYSRLYRL